MTKWMTFLMALLLGLGTATFVGCAESEDPADEVGDAMEEADDETGDAMEEAGDAMEDAADEMD